MERKYFNVSGTLVSYPRIGTVSDAEENADFDEEMEMFSEAGNLEVQQKLNDCIYLLYVGNAFLAILIGCTCASIFSKFFDVRR